MRSWPWLAWSRSLRPFCAPGRAVGEGVKLSYLHMRSASQVKTRRADELTDAQVAVASGTFRILADPTRLRLVHELLKGPRSVGALAAACGVSASAISHQLQRLRDQHLVSFTRDGNTLHYSLTDEHVGSFCREALYHADHVVTGKRQR